MSQAATTRPANQPRLSMTPHTLTPSEQLDALRRVQAQAEQRVKLGVQFFKAAESRTDQFREMIEKIKTEQDTLREELRNDMTRSLRGYDQWLGEIDRNLTNAIETLENRVGKLQEEWAEAQTKIDGMLKRSEAMYDQTWSMLESTLAASRHASPPEPSAVPTEVSAPIVDPTQQSTASPTQGSAESLAEEEESSEPMPRFYTQILNQMRDRESEKPKAP